jgi:hypothetical protein
MCRDYYLHTRKNGIYYVQFRDKVSGKLLTARSTGETEPRKAELKAELWKTSGIPTGRLRQPRTLEDANHTLDKAAAYNLNIIKKMAINTLNGCYKPLFYFSE